MNQPSPNTRVSLLLNTFNNLARLFEAVKPPPKISIAEWAETYRIVSSEEAAVPGPWRNDYVPYTVEVMDAISDPFIREIVMMWGAQLAKTNLLGNTIGYHIHMDPCPIMLVEPTGNLADSWSGKRFAAMIRDMPCLRERIPVEKGRTPGNTLREKIFPGGYLTIAGAQSAAELKGRPIRIVLFDEVDEAPRDLEGQGDPVILADIRTTGFANRKLILASTPTIKGRSRIETAFESSTKERWSHKCPACGEWSAFSWPRLKFDTLKMACPYCEKSFTKREWITSGGKWIAENPDCRARGFHVTTMDAPTLTWADLVNEWTEAQRRASTGDYNALKTFINTRLAETWELPGEAVESHELEKRREIYNAELPDGVCVLTMGVDVQDTRLAYEVVGWGLDYESWGIEYGEIWGDPRQGAVWNQIDNILARSWSYKNGKSLTIKTTAVDAGGHMTTQVYTYCKAREPKRVYAVKGQSGDRLPMTRPGKAKMNARLFMVGVDGIKADITSWLRNNNHGEGYCHFPIGEGGEIVNGYDTSYFDMLTAEKRVLNQNKHGRGVYSWVLMSGKRNEAFDCRVYARAALRITSNRDDILLKRLYSLAAWADGNVKAKPGKEPENTVAAPARKPRLKPPARSDRNKRAAEKSIIL